MRIAIVTDSTADLPPALADAMDIHVVPAILVVDGHQYQDGLGIARREFYQRLPQMNAPPTTASPSVGAFQQAYAGLLERGFEKILSIHAASTLSAIYSTARLAAQRFARQVEVIDSLQVSLGLGFQALAAAEAIAEGLSLKSILERLAEIRRRVRVIAMLDSLDQLRRSGRVSWARAGVGSLLRIKPFIELRDGRALRLGEVRTRAKGIARLAEYLKNLGPLERLAMLHTNAEREARALFESLDISLATPLLTVNVTTVIGAHVGGDGLGFAALPCKPS